MPEYAKGTAPEKCSGLKEALQYVVENSKRDVKTFTYDGKIYATEPLTAVAKVEYSTEPLKITTLNGFIDYVKENRDGIELLETLVQITGPSSVRLISIPDDRYRRACYIDSNAELPQIPFGRWLDIENFMITLQSSFAPSDDRETLMRYVGNLKEDESIQVTDDGVSQKIVARTGVSTVDTVILPNPVKLRPFRTFQELNQPESEFVLRIRKGGEIALFEADGGAWKVSCRALVKDALVNALKIVDGVCVIG